MHWGLSLTHITSSKFTIQKQTYGNTLKAPIIRMLICKNTPEFYSLQDTLYFRIADYSVVSTLNSVFYIGGDISGNYALSGQIPDKYLMNIIAEYKNLTWTQLELLAVPRGRHRSLYTNNKIFIVGSGNK